MKYLRTDVVLGCLQHDRNTLQRHKAELAKAQTDLGVVNASLNRDYMLWRENVEDLIQKVDRGHTVCRSDYRATVESFDSQSGRDRQLGETGYDVRQANEKVEKAYQAVVNHRPSALTVFLTGIDDEFITDSSIKSAGFDHGGLGRFVVLGKQGDS